VRISEANFFSRLRNIIKQKKYAMHDYPGYGGTGGPGLILEELLGFDTSNRDGPDSGIWEVKFHSGKSPLTLFHKTPAPKGVMLDLVKTCGWPDKSGRTSFRHTIYGESPRGFVILNENNRLVVKNPLYPDIVPPYWTHDTLINCFAYKLRRLVVVHGSKKDGYVNYEYAQLHKEPSITSFISAVENGIVAVDFDARTTDGNGLRDHGTKFRIAIKNLPSLYEHSEKFD
jgi:hypothetical protein